MKRFLPLFLAALTMGAATTAQAKTCEDITMPDSIEVNGQTLVLNGMGIREATIFNVNVYVAGLYLTEASDNGNAIARSSDTKRLVMRFVRDVSGEEIAEAIQDSFGDAGEGQARNIERLVEMLPDEISDGMSLTWTFHEGNTEVRVNDRRVGTLRGAAFARLFFRIFVGPNPPNRGLRRGLLGGEC